MQSLHAVAAAPWKIDIGEKSWWFSPLSLADWAILERRLLEGRRNPIDVARENLTRLADDEKRILLDAALRQASSPPRAIPREIAAFLATQSGLCLLFWLSLRKLHPEITEEDAWTLLSSLDAARLETVVAEAASLPASEGVLKN